MFALVVAVGLVGAVVSAGYVFWAVLAVVAFVAVLVAMLVGRVARLRDAQVPVEAGESR
jgi:energy-converting hydrogenase Eha subunit C